MIPVIILSALAICLPLAIATWQGWTTHHLLASTALSLSLAGGLVGLFLAHDQDADTALHDTYYVVAHFHWMLSLAILFAVLTALGWAAHRFARPIWPRAQRAAVLTLALGLFGPALLNAIVLIPSARLSDVEPWLPALNLVGVLGSKLSTIAALALFLIPLYALLFRRRR